MLIALEIILSRFFSIYIPGHKISFAFFPLALVGILYGPLYAGAAGAISDLIGAILFPVGPYFFGFTLSNTLVGMVYGIFLHKKANKTSRVVLAVLIVNFILNFGLGSFWLYLLMGNGVYGLIPGRFIRNLIMVPIKIGMIRTLGSKLFTLKEQYA